MSINDRKKWQEIAILDVPILADPGADVAWVVRQAMAAKSEPFIIFTPNPEQLVMAGEDGSYLKTLQEADLRIPDGAGVVWAIKKQGVQVARIAGVDVVSAFLRHFPTKKYAVLGGRNYLPNAKQGKIQVDDVELVWNSGYEKVTEPTRTEENNVADWLLLHKPDVLFVAFGAPVQEKWVINNLQLLKKAEIHVVMVAGGSFDFLLGKVVRAPGWVQKLELEWLFRLLQQPWRIGRQLKGSQFFAKVLAQEK